MSSRRRKWWRWLRRLATVTALAAAFTWYGWRFGFSRLPETAPGSIPSEAELFVAADRPASNFWYWIRELARTNALRADAPPPRSSMATPRPAGRPRTRAGAPTPAENRMALALSAASVPTDLAGWVSSRPEIAECLNGALSAPDRRPPRSLTRDDVVAYKLLLHASLWQAAGAEQAADMAGAVRAYVQAWRLLAVVVPPNEFPELFDERGGEEVNAELARPFRRTVLDGPALSPVAAAASLRDLEQTMLGAGRPAESYARLATRERPAMLAARAADWRRATRAFRTAGLLMRQDFFHLVMDLLARVAGRRGVDSPNYHAALYLIRPVQEVVFSAQAVAARPDDFEQIQQANLGQAVAALRSGALPSPGSAPWMPGYHRQRSWWRRVFDRPAVWRAAEALPAPQFTLESGHWWRVQLESCRLTLALRVFKDRHGFWPDRLDVLVPGVLPTLPMDPFSGRPFPYRRVGEGWQFWSVGPRGLADPGALDATPQRLFTSSETGSEAPGAGGS